MKTKAIIQKAAVMILLLITSIYSNAQTPVIVKTLEITIYAAEKYEASKQNLFLLIDSSKCRLISLNEVKTDNGNQKAVIEIAANDEGFKLIDKRLPNLGYIGFKKLQTEDKTSDMDTAGIRSEIIFQKLRKTKYEQQLAILKPENEQYKEVWSEINDIEMQVHKAEKLYVSAKSELSALQRMKITICE